MERMKLVGKWLKGGRLCRRVSVDEQEEKRSGDGSKQVQRGWEERQAGRKEVALKVWNDQSSGLTLSTF